VGTTLVIDVENYCRDIEAYLCRKNDGHLIRITGAAFEQVQGWATQGVPIKIAEAGIDRYFERYYRKGPRRRPVRIEFCEADVLDAFDDWRRAVGVARVVPDSAGGPDVEEPQTAVRPRRSLASQIDAAVARLTVLRGSDQAGASLGRSLDDTVRALDALKPDAAHARGDARDAVLKRLAEIDERLLQAAFATLSEPERSALEKEAEAELAPFRARMSDEAYRQSQSQAVQRLVRERFGFPGF
jgi:hypothetical protein